MVGVSGSLPALVESLRRPLALAARDGFRGLDELAELGGALREACDRLVAGPVPPERVGPLRAWRRELEAFERGSRSQREVKVARGLRLCAVLGGGGGGVAVVGAAVVGGAPAVGGAAVAVVDGGAAVGGAAVAPAARAAPVTARSRRADAPREGPSASPVGAVSARPASPAGTVSAPAPPPSPLTAPVRSLAGIGPALAARLAARGIETVEDLVWFVPRRYDDLRRVLSLADALAAPPGERVTFAAEVARVRYVSFRRRFLEVRLFDRAAPELAVTARWFQVGPGMARRFEVGRRVVVSGPLRQREGAWELAHPDLCGDPDADGGIRAEVRPRYPEVEGVAPAVLRRVCRLAAARVAASVPDGVPADMAARMGLAALGEALARLHDPPDDLGDDDALALCRGESAWHRRLAFDELFFLSLAVLTRRAERRAAPGTPCRPPPGARAQAVAALPFALTGAQARVLAELEPDLASDEPMSRLLQGDVGAGKTAVAFVAAHLVLAAGRQVAVMAPTEILAEQHFRTLEPWARAIGHRTALLTAATPRGARESTLSLLAAGPLGLLVGTHALLAERVGFHDLGLVIVDEQHRFGVAQRVRLREKGAEPHLLVMTATPIPRTLALTVYGDLDLSVLDELPPGRTPPVTQVLAGVAGKKRAFTDLRRHVARGERAFVVCPLVEPAPDLEGPPPADAVSTAAELAAALAPARVGLVHGRVSAVERDAAMAALRSGELQVLVATTVIEVGVDVPEATLMVVLDADRFGLAQLHQLRGRVGRGSGASTCLLVHKGARTSDAERRLAIMAETTCGFRIAEEDLAIRGPGELLGARQAGLPRLRFGSLVTHAALLVEARREAQRLLDEDPGLARHPLTEGVLAERIAGAQAFGGESG